MSTKPEAKGDDFNPSLGTYVADSWFDLGKRIGALQRAQSEEEREELLSSWRDATLARIENRIVGSNNITTDALGRFADELLRLLRQKYEGKPIADEIRRRISVQEPFGIVSDAEQYVERRESAETFWANEYFDIFSELTKPANGGPGWLQGVAVCGYHLCDVFFIRSRRDQRFHSDTCRAKAAKKAASHTKKR